MIDSSPVDRQTAKEIMIVYISALGGGAEVLFRRDEHQLPANKSFAEAWETIIKTVSDHN